MEVTINGVAGPLPQGTLADLIAARALSATGLVVELNRRIVKEEDWALTRLQEGDCLELLSFVGGG